MSNGQEFSLHEQSHSSHQPHMYISACIFSYQHSHGQRSSGAAPNLQWQSGQQATYDQAVGVHRMLDSAYIA